MPDILLVILAVVFVLGVAINIHEFGHFIVARLLGMRVEAYSFFGIGPRIWGFKKGNTDYRISAIPLGAYVKLYGDEATASLEGGSSDGEEVAESELYELRPKWQKFLVMIGGPFMNIVLALAIPFTMGLIQGVPSDPSPVVGHIKENSAADKAGVQIGDRIIGYDGVKNPTWMRIQEDTFLLPDKETPMTVERDGTQVDLKVTPNKIVRDGNAIGSLGLYSKDEVETVVIKDVSAGKPAAKAGLQKGDEIVSINGNSIPNRGVMIETILDSKEKPVEIVANRNGVKKQFTLNAEKISEKTYQIGAALGSNSQISRDAVGIGGAINYAFEANWRILRLTGKAFGQMFAGERSVKEGGIAGPVGIVQIISQIVTEAGFAGLFPILMVISLNLGIFNLLPIPLLDGGQIAVLGIEAVLAMFGMTLSMAIKEKIQLAGLAIIMVLMVVVLYFDISRIIG
ncbi:MAG: RIP metalloprotease RseP [Acidobacteriota bacterium]|jgi:regulator of sigma E protease|nr:RIP metalloprotease RseP [Acidobacteriota bacterium]